MWTEKSRHERGKRMLKGIPKILSPELLKVLCEMGHSDRLVIADGNFPAESMGKDAIVIRMDDMARLRFWMPFCRCFHWIVMWSIR